MRVLVPLDGSVISEQALGVAAHLVFTLPAAHLVLLRVVAVTPMALTATDYQRVYGVASDACDDYLREVAHRDLLHGLSVERHVTIGVPAQAICDTARSLHADVIIMTSHGRTGLARFALGSIAEDVVRDSTIPTLIIRDAETILTPSRILVPLDGSSFAEAVLDPASQLARGWHAEMRLLRVVHSPTSDSASDREQIAAARAYLEAIKDRFESAGVTTSISVMMGAPQERIRAAAAHEHYPCDLVALAPHERTPLEKLETGSVTAYLFHHLHCSLLIVHPQPVTVAATP